MLSPESGPAAPPCACSRPRGRWRESIPARPSLPAAVVLLAFRLCLVAALIALTGCAAGPAPTTPAVTAPLPKAQPTLTTVLAPAPVTPSATSEPGPVTIVLWHAWYGEAINQLLAEMASRFHESHPTITVQPVSVGDEQDVLRKTIAAIQAGNPPDLAVACERDIVEFIRADAVAPLEPYIGDPEIGLTQEDKDDIFPGFWETSIFPEFGGKMLSFPFAKGALAMFYNTTALKAAGVQVPKTWADFEAACRAFSKGDVKGLAWAESASTFDGFLYSRGARQLNEDQSEAIFNGPEGVESLDLLVRLGDEGAAYRPEGDEADRAAFARGRAVFTFGSTVDISSYEQAIKDAGSTFQWGVTCLPQADASKLPRTAMYGANICILKTDEARQRAAWQFITWFADTAQTAEWGSQSGYAPIRRSAMKQLADSGWLDENPIAGQVYDEIVPYAYPEPNVRGEQEVRTIIEDAWTAALTGAMTTQQALDDAVAKANEALASNK